MAYTKCANPEYQFEVDTLMLEYTLYKAIEYQLEALACLSDDVSTADEVRHVSSPTTAHKATNWTENFDVLNNLFNLHHGKHLLTEGTQFGIYLLQFLVLLNTWREQSDVVKTSFISISDTMHEQLRVSRLVNRAFRRHYLRARDQRDASKVPEVLDASSPTIAKSISCADHIVPLFLNLSEKLKSGLDMDHLINKKWFSMCVQLMTRAAVEKLQQFLLCTTVEKNVNQTHQELRECFAWGYFTRMRYANDKSAIIKEFKRASISTAVMSALDKQAEIEDNVWEMFGDAGDDEDIMQVDGASQPPAHEEFAEWTRMRDSRLSEVLKAFTSLQLDVRIQEMDIANPFKYSSTAEPIQFLLRQYPLGDLMLEIHDFMSRMFRWIYSSDRSGKPRLVQIEEGGLEDLTDAEFEDFTTRANI